MRKFEVVQRFKGMDIPLPQRETQNSVGYDVSVAEDTILMPYNYSMNVLSKHINTDRFTEEIVEEIKELAEDGFEKEANELDFKTIVCSLEEMETYTKRTGVRPTLVSTGLKAICESDESIELVLRSSTPLKYWITMANSIGIIDGRC